MREKAPFWGQNFVFGEEIGELMFCTIVLLSLFILEPYNFRVLTICGSIYVAYCLLCYGIMNVTGIANAIFVFFASFTGLTTAAGLWATACLGLVIGIGFYFAALVAFLAILITITFLIWLEMKTKNKKPFTCYVECSDSHRLKALYHDFKPYISRVNVVPAKSGIPTHVGLEIKANSASEYELLLKKAEDNDDVIIALPLQN